VGHRHIRFPLEQLVEALQKYSPLRQLGEIEGHPKAETGPQIILKTQKDSPASETGESLTKTLSERKNGLVEMGEGRTPSSHTVHSLVNERRAMIVEFIM
jgi:hypothetical protein